MMNLSATLNLHPVERRLFPLQPQLGMAKNPDLRSTYPTVFPRDQVELKRVGSTNMVVRPRFTGTIQPPPVKTMVQHLAGENVQIAWREYGNPQSDNVIVALHGATRNSQDFDPLARYLAGQQDYRIICPDIVGRGESGWFKTAGELKYNLFVYTEQMEKLFKHLNLQQKPLTLIGTSMGGLIGLQLAAKRNSPVRRLILNDVGPEISMASMKDLIHQLGQKEHPVFASMEEVKTYFKQRLAGFGQLDEPTWSHIAKASVKPDLQTGTFKLNYDPQITKGFHRYLGLTRFMLPFMKLGFDFGMDLMLRWSSIPLRAAWDKLQIPVLVLRGQHSTLLTPQAVQQMQQNRSHVTAVTIPNTGHAPSLMTVPQIDLIRKWLAKTPVS